MVLAPCSCPDFRCEILSVGVFEPDTVPNTRRIYMYIIIVMYECAVAHKQS